MWDVDGKVDEDVVKLDDVVVEVHTYTLEDYDLEEFGAGDEGMCLIFDYGFMSVLILSCLT